MIVSIDPTTGGETFRRDYQTGAEVDAVLEAAAAAQRSWRRQPVPVRATLLRRVAAEFRRDRDHLARLVTLEMGKPIVEAGAEIEKCALCCDFYAERAEAFLAPEPVETSARDSMVVWDPLGVVLAIMPWNYPFWQLVRCLAPALIGGNGVVLKHANNVPRCAEAAAELLRRAEAPAGLFGVLFIENGDVEAVIGDRRIAAVSLTGSTQVGSIVGAQAGRAIKPQVLELGGSDPFVVLADADIEAAARIAVKARFSNTGQSCISAKRFIVVASAVDAFNDAFMRHLDALRMGDPNDRSVGLGPMARANLRDELHRQVGRSVAAGAGLLRGGRAGEGAGFFYAPTVLDRVTETMAAFAEETFGPVAAVVHARDTADAIRLANLSEFGLGASLWTRDLDAAHRLVREIEAGAVFVNAMVASDPRMPFGGIKRSGYGRELGVHGMRAFLNTKTVWIGGDIAAPSRAPE